MKEERESLNMGKIEPKNAPKWFAAVDLGSNTFQYVVGKKENGLWEMPFRKKLGAKIGIGSLANKWIQDEALGRAIPVLKEFRTDFETLEIPPERQKVIGTSAFRNAENKKDVLSAIKNETGFEVEIIEGEREAELIFEGVKASGSLRVLQNQLVVDIGGGSVEFLICQGFTPVWKKSFEIGGLRLIEKFQKNDPISVESRNELLEYAEKALKDFWEALKSYPLEAMVGVSGSFETLVAMEMARQNQYWEEMESLGCYDLPLPVFNYWLKKITPLPLKERLQIPGMLALRAEMMVAGILLVDLLLQKTKVNEVRVSTFSLKEGVLVDYF